LSETSSNVERAWVLATAKGFCEACANQAPFFADDGSPFLEVHHVKMLADGVPTKSRTPSHFVQIATVASIIQPIVSHS
jgi:hypothetical protein